MAGMYMPTCVETRDLTSPIPFQQPFVLTKHNVHNLSHARKGSDNYQGVAIGYIRPAIGLRRNLPIQ